MTDKELLELAAKAAGYEVRSHANARYSSDLHFIHKGHNWNPLVDDGDALRLAVKLCCQESIGNWIDRHCTATEYRADQYAATRRTIVRAAAEIGKEMK